MYAMQQPSSSPPAAEVVTGTQSAGAAHLAACRRRLLASASVELSTNHVDKLARAARLLPPATNVYIPQLPGRRHTEAVTKVRMVHEAGLKPVPHIAARALASTAELEEFLRLVADAGGTDRVLVIGGDAESPAGPFGDSASIMSSGVLEAHGIRRVDIAGYPDGHPRIPAATLHADLMLKTEIAQRAGFDLEVITQFSFDPEKIAAYCGELARVAPGVTVRPGLTGPTSAARLLHFARVCGVTTSVRAISKIGLDAVRLLTVDPTAELELLARRCASDGAGRLGGIHLFTFGGFVESAEWLHNQFRSS